MQNIVLIAPEGFRPGLLKENLPDEWRRFLVSKTDPDGVRFSGPQNAWSIQIEEQRVLRDLAEDEYWSNDSFDLEFRESLGGKSFFLVYYTRGEGYSVLKRLLPVLLRPLAGRLHELWVDNTYGRVTRADRLLAKWEEDPSWGWADDLIREGN